VVKAGLEWRKWYREAGLVVIALIYLWAYLTSTGPFWAGKATFFGAAVVLAVALIDQVI